MPYSTVNYSKQEHVAQITLNRPEAGNAINVPMAQELVALCCQVNQDSDVYAVVLTGAGEVFCRGSELEQLLQSGKSEKAPGEVGVVYRVASAIASIDRPVIAAINGDALGQGLELALGCDLRWAVPEARFGLPQVALGLIPMDGGTQRLPRIIGRSQALELILGAELIGAQKALELGLINKLVSRPKLGSEVEELAKALASKAPIALRYAKEAVNKGMDLTLEQGCRLEADLYAIINTTSDKAEGVRAFLQKRPAEFKNR